MIRDVAVVCFGMRLQFRYALFRLRRRRFIAAFVLPFLAVLCAIVVLRLTTPEYTAAMTVAPTGRGAGAGLRAADVGRDVASAVAEPGAADEALSDFARYLELLRALPTAERLVDDPAFMRPLFASSWDAAAENWAPPGGFWPSMKRAALAAAGRVSWSPPDAPALAGALRRQVTIAPVGTGPMRRVTFRHRDRDYALFALRRLAQAADAHLKAEAARRAQVQIDHIRGRLAGNALSKEHAAALARLQADEERVLMALGVDLPYAADAVEPPHAAALPDWPDALLTIGVSGLAGVFGAVFLIGAALRRDAGQPAAGAAAPRRGPPT